MNYCCRQNKLGAILKIISAFISVLCLLWTGMCMDVEAAEGDNVVTISNAEELLDFAQRVNSGETGLDAVLTADIVFNEGEITESSSSARVWTPIGNDFSNRYAGTFDGQGHTISGLYFNNTSANHVGLFGYTNYSSVIRNVGVINSYFGGNQYVGGICGRHYGDMINCYNTGTINGNSYIGGICGNTYGNITDCYNTGTATGTKERIGGICGNIPSGTITNCYNTGTLSGNSFIGGICGYSSGTVTNCYNTNTVNVSNSMGASIGGICGQNYGSITCCYNIGTVSSGRSFTGSICGYNAVTITDCFYLTGTYEAGIGEGSGEAMEMTVDQFASGEAVYLLNGSVDGGTTWYQTLDSDNYPVLDSSHGRVYLADGGYTNNPGPAGDVNGDGRVNEADAGLILKYISGIIPAKDFGREYNIIAGDYNNDDYVDIADVIAILAA